jgi:peptide deformylase
MTIRKIVPKSVESLQPCIQVNDFKDKYVVQAIRDMLDSLAAEQHRLDEAFPGKGGGVGLASNQIEYPVPDYPAGFTPPNMYVVSIRPERAFAENCESVAATVYINASFKPLPDAQQSSYEEGCLSVVGFKGYAVPRYEKIQVHAYDIHGNANEFAAENFVARVHQHEMDHGRGQEYLNQLRFGNAELLTISVWIAKNKNSNIDAPVWVVPEKLQCILNEPDFKALEAWVENELAT